MEISIHPAREFSPEEEAAAKEQLFEDTMQENEYMRRLLLRWLERGTQSGVTDLCRETFDYLYAK